MRVTVGDLALDLTDDQVDDLRVQLAVDSRGAAGMLTTAEAAERLGFSTDYVREHATELGGVKLTAGPKAPWRFDPAKLCRSGDSPAREASPPATPRRRAPRRAGSGHLLKVRG